MCIRDSVGAAAFQTNHQLRGRNRLPAEGPGIIGQFLEQGGTGGQLILHVLTDQKTDAVFVMGPQLGLKLLHRQIFAPQPLSLIHILPGGSAVTVNGLEGTLSSGYEGCYVSLRVSNEDGSALSVSVDSVTKYVQGGIKAFTWASSTNTVTLTDPATGKSTSYDAVSYTHLDVYKRQLM